MPLTCIAVFAKAPVAGQVKTRLIPSLGAQAAADLYCGLARHTLTTVCTTTHAVELWCHPDTHHEFFVEMGARFTLTLREQRGDDLGARMAHAFSHTLERSERVVLIGCDCPAMTQADIEAAFDGLRHHDAVFGPATDGGYWLIGLRRWDKSLFEGIDWGSNTVLNDTVTRLRRLDWRWQQLTERADIDRPEDLIHVPSALRTG